MNIKDILQIQITTDFEILFNDIKAGLYNGRVEDERQEWEKLNKKIRHYQILKKQEKQ